MKPWREVARPHKDVLEETFQQSDFAADISRVANGTATTEYRDLTPRNLAKSIGIKTVKLQRGYGHPGQPPAQMRFEVASVGLLDPDDRECDPYNIPPGFIATTIAIHLGKRVG